jgi:hypothetical protein
MTAFEPEPGPCGATACGWRNGECRSTWCPRKLPAPFVASHPVFLERARELEAATGWPRAEIRK